MNLSKYLYKLILLLIIQVKILQEDEKLPKLLIQKWCIDIKLYNNIKLYYNKKIQYFIL